MLIPELGVEIDAEIASVLTAGIVQDTHTFSHPNTTPRTLRVAADLVEAGAPLAAIHRSIYADKPFSTLALWGEMLAGVGAAAGGADRVRRDDDRHARGDRHRSGRLRGIHRPARLHQGCRHHDPLQGGRCHAHAGQRSHLARGPTPWPSPRHSAAVVTRAPRGARSMRRWRRRRRGCSRSASASSIGPMLGVVNLDKPVGPTSHDMVGMMRRLTRHAPHRPCRHPRPAGLGRPPDPRRRRNALQRGADGWLEALRRGHPARGAERHGRRRGADRRHRRAASRRGDGARGAGGLRRHVRPAAANLQRPQGRRSDGSSRRPRRRPDRRASALGHDPFTGAARLRPR